MDSTQREEYVVFSSGMDWLTCTAKSGRSSLELERVADAEIENQRASGVNVVPQSWLGFEGYKLEGLYFGRRDKDVMLCLSGSMAHDLGPLAIQSATNISRLDLQVTICSNGEVLELARNAWSQLKSADHPSHRPRSFSFIVGHPVGQTLYINSRASDNFARIYDKGVESKLCPAGMMWRYEVEFKRKVSKQESLALAPSQQLAADVCDRVHSWLTSRGVEPPWPAPSSYVDISRARGPADRDVLTWFNKSLSVSIGKAITQYGLVTVLESLGLHTRVEPKVRRDYGHS